MKVLWSLGLIIAGLVLWTGPSWGATPDTPRPIFVDDEILHNTAGGLGALESNDGSSNTAFGTHALQDNTTGVNNTAVGADALQHNQPFLGVGGSGNTAVGFEALMFNRNGQANTAIGAGALTDNRTGTDNTASGVNALSKNSDGQSNTATGRSALNDNFDGNNNTATGRSALNLNIDGNNNTAIGVNALFSNAARDPCLGVVDQCGDNNTAIGFNALQRNTTGSDNTALGEGAGQNLLSGNNNIYLRAFAGGTDAITQESNTMRLGRDLSPSAQRTFIAGITGPNVMPVSGSTVMIDNDGRLGVALSSARYKRDIQTMGTRSQGLLQLRPVTFRYKEDTQGELEYGLIAEEVAEVYPELVTRRDNGEVESVRYHVLIPMLLNELQHQQGQLGVQAEQLSALKAENERLWGMVVQQKERDAALTARLERLERLETAAAPAALANR
jgi:hypothetical protein